MPRLGCHTVRRINFVLATAAAGLLLTSGPSRSQDTFGDDAYRDDLIVLKGHARVLGKEAVDTVVVFHGSATINGFAKEVVALNAPITVTGSVGEDVISFNSTVTLVDGANVGGDVVSRREPVIDPGATVGGDILRDDDMLFIEPFPFFGRLVAWLGITISTLALGFILLGLAPRGLDAVEAAWQGAVWPSVGWGVLILFGLPFLAILAFVSLVGIPLAVALALGLFLIYSVSYTLGAWVLGRRLMERSSRPVALLVGLGILRLFAVVPVLAGLIGLGAAAVGLGATIVAVWRARRPATLTA